MKMDLRKKPFNLDEEAVLWVENSLQKMTTDEKIAQLFCLDIREGTDAEFEEMVDAFGGIPGGVLYRAMPLESAHAFTSKVQNRASIPALVVANLEKGGNGIVKEGTAFASPMGVAATDDDEMVRKMARVCAREAKTVGANWTYSPVIDIDFEYHNPITNTRTFGSDPERVARMGKIFVETIQEEGIAATIKHFPGDGVDERDQHLLASVNTMSCEAWDETFGKAYKASIDAGALSVMAAHIMHPAYSKALNPEIRDEEILPGSLSKELMGGLLRDKLGFNGLIVTDSTLMAGFTNAMPRRKAVPYAIEAGADMFLFTRVVSEDFEFMRDGLATGILSEKRLEEAVMRVLALKAAMGLHKSIKLPSVEEARTVVGCSEHRTWAKECAERAITLVKEQKDVLPLKSGKRILFIPLENRYGEPKPIETKPCQSVYERLVAEGFDVEIFSADTGIARSEKYDYILYVANLKTRSNQTVVRIEWGTKCPHYIEEIPTIFVSLENPYHLLDIPRVKTYINCYNSNDDMVQVLIDKLIGKSEFQGKSPIDPFCGKLDARLG
jgi:beta-N-acetylhexosaminidase